MSAQDNFAGEFLEFNKTYGESPLRSFRRHPYPWAPINTSQNTQLRDDLLKKYSAKPRRPQAKPRSYFEDHETVSQKEEYEPSAPVPLISGACNTQNCAPEEELWLLDELAKWGLMGFISMVVLLVVWIMLDADVEGAGLLASAPVLYLLAVYLYQRIEGWAGVVEEEKEPVAW